jgi:adenylylsulfate kinase
VNEGQSAIKNPPTKTVKKWEQHSGLAAALVKRLRMFDNEILLLDGNELREVFCVNSINVENYGRDKRIALAMQCAYLCNILAK